MLPIILTSVAIAASVSLLLHMVWVGNQGTETDAPLSTEQMREHVVWRSFYVNPDDPRGWVPKTFGFGITVNFRTMSQVYMFVSLIIIALLSSLALTVAVL